MISRREFFRQSTAVIVGLAVLPVVGGIAGTTALASKRVPFGDHRPPAYTSDPRWVGNYSEPWHPHGPNSLGHVHWLEADPSGHH